MKKNMSWKFTDESFVTFQSSVSGPGEFGLRLMSVFLYQTIVVFIAHFQNKLMSVLEYSTKLGEDQEEDLTFFIHTIKYK